MKLYKVDVTITFPMAIEAKNEDDARECAEENYADEMENGHSLSISAPLQVIDVRTLPGSWRNALPWSASGHVGDITVGELLAMTTQPSTDAEE